MIGEISFWVGEKYEPTLISKKGQSKALIRRQLELLSWKSHFHLFKDCSFHIQIVHDSTALCVEQKLPADSAWHTEKQPTKILNLIKYICKTIQIDLILYKNITLAKCLTILCSFFIILQKKKIQCVCKRNHNGKIFWPIRIPQNLLLIVKAHTTKTKLYTLCIETKIKPLTCFSSVTCRVKARKR